MSEIEVTVEGLDRRGDGVARGPDGATLRLPGALPGERALVRVQGGAEDEGEGESAAARLTRLLEPSPARVTPPCPHAAECGGCALQHADPAWLANWKRERVAAALARRGLETELAQTVVSPPRSRRRAAFAATRRKSGVALGFRRARDTRIVDIRECLLIRPEIASALPALRELTRLAASRAADLRLSVTTSEDGLDVAVDGAKRMEGGAADADLMTQAARWAEEADAARLTWNDEPLLLRRPPRQRFGRALATPPPGAFLQATAEGEAALVARAVDALAGARRLGDLFAGAGTFTLPLAERAEVLAVEGDAAMTAALEQGWRAAEGLKRVAAVTRDLFRRPLSAAELRGLDGALFDPPRAGAEAQAHELAAAPFQRLVGVSCDPASFARDAAILARGGWRLERVTPVDQFLWSAHVELIGVFSR